VLTVCDTCHGGAQ
jgi:hypothetical protein